MCAVGNYARAACTPQIVQSSWRGDVQSWLHLDMGLEVEVIL